MGPESLTFDERGLAPAIVQEAASGEVLMLAYVDAEAIRRTLETKTTWFWSRSRAEYWNKAQPPATRNRSAKFVMTATPMRS